MAQAKTRLDTLLVELGYFESKEKARTCIMSNGVYIAGTLVNKPGRQINTDKFYKQFETNPEYLKVENKISQYVSRGAFKLKAAHEAFGLDFRDKLVLDIGASTGGFTDYILQNGARKVIALDVGKGQLHYKLQNDERVINLEGLNFKEFDFSQIPAQGSGLRAQGIFDIDLIVVDVSFISLITILEKVKNLQKASPNLEPRAQNQTKQLQLLCLIKPQFEAGKEIMDKCQGVIKDEKIRHKVLDKTLKSIIQLGYKQLGLIKSSIKGNKGNVEYLAFLEC